MEGLAFRAASHLDMSTFILIGVSAVHNYKFLHHVAELACQQGHHLQEAIGLVPAGETGSQGFPSHL